MIKFRKEYVVIFTIQVTEVLGFSLILPFLPLFAEDLGASAFTATMLLATFSLAQFLTSPIMGRLSDHYGRKPLLILSQISTCLSFIILGFSNSLWMVFLSRLVDGVLGSNFTIAQAYLSDISSKKNRAKALGLSGVAFGVGFLIGPAIGGFLATRYGYSLPAFIAAAMAFATILITTFILPETIKEIKPGPIDLKIISLEEFAKYFKMPSLKRKFLIFFFYILAHVTWVTGFSLFADRSLGWDPARIGWAMTYVGVVSIITRGYLINKMIDILGERWVIKLAAISMMIGLSVVAFLNKTWHFYVVMTFFSLGSGSMRPTLLAQISKTAPKGEQGGVMGISNSLGSIAQIIGPIIAGLMLTYFFPGALGIAAALSMALGFIIILKEFPASHKSLRNPHAK